MRLAEAFLQSTIVRSPYDNDVRRALRLPDASDKRRLSIEALHHIAERIVYTNDIPSLLYMLDDNKQITFDGILRTVRLPYDNFWIEYKTAIDRANPNFKEDFYWGTLVRKRPDGVWIYVCAGLPRDGKLHACVANVIRFQGWPPARPNPATGKDWFGYDVMFSFQEDQLERDLKAFNVNRDDYGDALFNFNAVLIEVLFGIFLVTQPKLLEEVKVTPSPALQRQRARKGKPPLFEYRKIKVHLGEPRKLYQRNAGSGNTDDPDSDRAVQHRRYHKVMGHFRHYVTGPNPHTTWIEPHYRGDPKLGVTFIERDVSR